MNAKPSYLLGTVILLSNLVLCFAADRPDPRSKGEPTSSGAIPVGSWRHTGTTRGPDESGNPRDNTVTMTITLRANERPRFQVDYEYRAAPGAIFSGKFYGAKRVAWSTYCYHRKVVRIGNE